jgi:hypothetical protein
MTMSMNSLLSKALFVYALSHTVATVTPARNYSQYNPLRVPIAEHYAVATIASPFIGPQPNRIGAMYLTADAPKSVERNAQAERLLDTTFDGRLPQQDTDPTLIARMQDMPEYIAATMYRGNPWHLTDAALALGLRGIFRRRRARSAV